MINNLNMAQTESNRLYSEAIKNYIRRRNTRNADKLDAKLHTRALQSPHLNSDWSQIASRARMFSPSTLVKNVGEFKQMVIESRKLQNKPTYNHRNEEGSRDYENCQVVCRDKYETMKLIHSNLIYKASKLIENAKNSRFEGFYSPQMLRRRIRRGNLSYIPWSPIVIKRRTFSPCWRTEVLDWKTPDNNTHMTPNMTSKINKTNNEITNLDSICNTRALNQQKYIESKRIFWRSRREDRHEFRSMTTNEDNLFSPPKTLVSFQISCKLGKN